MGGKKMRTFAGICAALEVVMLSTGCASRYSDEGLRKRFVGKSRAQLLSCAGAPTSQESGQNQEFLTYSTEALAGYGGNIQTRSCRMNFTLTNGFVTQVTGSWYGPLLNKSEACDRMFYTC